MSTGLELIPFALVGLIHIAKIVRDSLQEAESSGTLRIDTRMTDKALIRSSLEALGHDVIDVGDGLHASGRTGTFNLALGEGGSFIALCDQPDQFQRVADGLVAFEQEYVRQLQQSIVEEITSNAQNLGYAITQEELPNQAVRLSVRVSA